MIAADWVANLLAWSLQAGVVAAAASVLSLLFRLDVAGVRYTYWRAVACLCLALPWIQPYRSVHVVATAETLSVSRLPAESASAVTAPLHGGEWAEIVLAVIAIGLIGRVIWLACGLVRLRRLRHSAAALQRRGLDADLQPTLRVAADVRYSSDLHHPVTFGLRKPVVLLPDSLRTQPSDIQRAVLAHEMLHVQRRDWAWLVVEEVAVCLFWFHPASWWLASRIQLAREEVVDELAILMTGRRKSYVEALLAFADATSVVPTAAFARRRHLLRRIALVSKEDVMSSRRIVATCAAMALMLGLGSWYAVSAFPLQKSEPAARVISGPLELQAHSVTPENPIPRRTHYEPPALPDSIGSVRGSIGIQLTLDEVGRIAESRVVDVSVGGSDFDMRTAGLEGRGFRWLGTVENESADTRAKAIRVAQDVMDAAVASVRQWRYDPPAEAPLTFTVRVQIKNGPDVMQFKASDGSDPLRVGGEIKAPKKIRDVRPVYPPIARQANVTGVVIIEARIGADGFIEEAHVLKSIPLLDEAALDAVKQWQFEPTLLNGQPVPVMMTLSINFAQ
jgi:TonB family protein